MKRIGVIAEDVSDVHVLEEIIKKYGLIQFKLVDFVGNGCARIPAKCQRWSANLQERGCTFLILLHDSDGRNVKELRGSLDQALRPYAIGTNVIVIPVEEIEAWLLSDEIAVQRAMHLKTKIKKFNNPETVHDPKAKLAREIFQKSKRKITYLNTRHNRLIARETSLVKFRKCASFLPLDHFIKKQLL